jgi:hypothetical protein
MDPQKIVDGLVDGAVIDDPDGAIRIEVVAAGELDLPTGRVIACDPGGLSDKDDLTPLARTVPPGRYPVQVGVANFNAGGRCVALAALRLSPTPPVRFEPAARDGEDLATFEDDEVPVHGVDSGASCFVDLRTAEELVRRNQDWDYLWNEYGKLLSLDGGEWKNVAVDPESGLNLVEFTSGFGDGSYVSYWGFDGDGRAVCLVTDFGILGGSTCP